MSARENKYQIYRGIDSLDDPRRDATLFPSTHKEIEAKKTVPMAMLWDIFSTNGGSREIFCDIAARYGYEVTE